MHERAPAASRSGRRWSPPAPTPGRRRLRHRRPFAPGRRCALEVALQLEEDVRRAERCRRARRDPSRGAAPASAISPPACSASSACVARGGSCLAQPGSRGASAGGRGSGSRGGPRPAGAAGGAPASVTSAPTIGRTPRRAPPRRTAALRRRRRDRRAPARPSPAAAAARDQIFGQRRAIEEAERRPAAQLDILGGGHAA